MSYRPEWESSGEHRGGFGGRGWNATKILLVSLGAVFVVSLLADGLKVAADSGPRNVVLHFLSLRLNNFYWVYPLVSYAFVHSLDDPLHIIVNGLVIYFFGPSIEAAIGRRRFLGLFFGAVALGGFLHLASQSIGAGYPDQMLVGASGGALGLLFYAAWATPNQTVIFLFFPMRVRTLAYIYLAMNLWPVIRQVETGVAYWCHLGGALFGYLYWKFSWDPLQWFTQAREVIEHKADARREEQSQASDEEMDRILQKISEQGLPSLTKAERRFLDERSRSMRKGGR